MTGIFEKKNRTLVPNWRSVNKTAQLGELESIYKDKDVFLLPSINLEKHIVEFHENKSSPYAADLINAAIVGGKQNDDNVKEAASFILESSNTSTCLTSLAKNILDPYDFDSEYDLSHLNLNDLDDCFSVKYHYILISDLKKSLSECSFNPLVWVELARNYLILGVKNKAIKAMGVALQQAADNRYVIRCAARLFAHFDDLDYAHHLLKKSYITRTDPWVMATEISISSLLNKNSRNIKRGIEMVHSAKYSPFSISELASSIGTIELNNGSRKKSKKLFKKSLESPNDNSLAQLEWIISEKDKTLFDASIVDSYNGHSFEAHAYYNYHTHNLVSALNYVTKWFCDMPYSKRPVMLGTHIAHVLNNLELAVRFVNKGLIAYPNDNALLNNLAYFYALENRCGEASEVINRISLRNESNDSIRTCCIATIGLIAFRNRDYEKGRLLYKWAINESYNNDDKYHNWLATLNYAREEMLAKTNHIEQAMDLVRKIPISDVDDFLLKKLHKEVIELYSKLKL